MREVLLLGAAGLALAGCGFSTESNEASGSGSATELTITVGAQDADSEVMTLTCDPAGGDHPGRAAACATLLSADPEVFEPVPADQSCTMIYGGPQTATIVGVLDGTRIDAAFSRQNGCEIARWDALGPDVFGVPVQ